MKGLAKLVALIVLLGLAWLVGGRLLARRWEREANQAWTSLGSPMTGFASRWPRHGLNASARELDLAAASLGIALAAPDAAGRSLPAARDAKAFDAMRGELGHWLGTQLARPSDRIDPPPEAVAAYLAARGPQLRALVSQLRADAPPVWEQDVELLADAPIPYLRGHRALNELLCALGLELQRQGRGGEALQALEAATKATWSLQERPELISRAVELSLLATQAGALRKLDGVPPDWYARLTGTDLAKATLVSLQCEAWTLGETLRRSRPWPDVAPVPGRAGAAPSLSARATAFLERPYALLAAADYTRALARAAKALSELGNCAFEAESLKALDQRALDEVGLWNVVGRVALPSVAQFWTAAERVRFQQELTGKVLRLKALRAAATGRAWPERPPGIESSACPGNRWTYVVNAQGGVVLTASQSPTRATPAVRYEGAAPTPGAR